MFEGFVRRDSPNTKAIKITYGTLESIYQTRDERE